MIRRLTKAIPSLTLCLALSNNAFAQLKDNLELNLFGAGSIYTNSKYLVGYPQVVVPVPGVPGELSFDTAARFGVRLGVYTRGRWGQEFFYSFEPNTVSISGIRPFPVDIRVRAHNYGVNALYYLVETESNPMQPFLSAGLGGALYEIRQESNAYLRNPAGANLPDADNANELAFNFGVGFKVRSNGWFGLRMDARDYVIRTPSFGLARQSIDPAATVLPATGVTNNAELSIGISIYFNKR